MEEVKLLSTVEEIRALSDPYRYKILNCFYKNGEPITVKQVADELGEVPAKVHYHVKKMEKAGILVLVHTKEINGIIAKYYEPTAKRFNIVGEEVEGMDKSLKLSEALKVISQLFDDSKNVFLENASLNPYHGENKKVKWNFVAMENIFLTDEEADNLIRYIHELTEKNNKKQRIQEGNVKEYHCFLGITRMRDK
ncbi:winged helix-turn-helix domain-containing protein [Clostridium thermarum]|uniref:winged helix-turn-helix domain-containing protein n=1 Tax=Clostridium thermarum TaxID=1716543 RepID=UPI0013D8832B|nr:helix-turn-helix domain-containing protein [Clostridium thermarum]